MLSDRNRGLEFEIKRMEDQLAEKDDMIKKIQEQRPAKVIGENTIEKKESVPGNRATKKMSDVSQNGQKRCFFLYLLWIKVKVRISLRAQIVELLLEGGTKCIV